VDVLFRFALGKRLGGRPVGQAGRGPLSTRQNGYMRRLGRRLSVTFCNHRGSTSPGTW
jgi:hypothetical protein